MLHARWLVGRLCPRQACWRRLVRRRLVVGRLVGGGLILGSLDFGSLVLVSLVNGGLVLARLVLEGLSSAALTSAGLRTTGSPSAALSPAGLSGLFPAGLSSAGLSSAGLSSSWHRQAVLVTHHVRVEVGQHGITVVDRRGIFVQAQQRGYCRRVSYAGACEKPPTSPSLGRSRPWSASKRRERETEFGRPPFLCMYVCMYGNALCGVASLRARNIAPAAPPSAPDGSA